MGCYFTLCHNTYGYSLLFYKVYMRRENAGSWNSGLEMEQILETYSAQLQKSWNSTEHLKINKEKSTPKMKARGPTPCSRGWGRPPTSWGPWWLSDVHLLLYEVFRWEKNKKELFGTRLRRHEVEPWRNQPRALAELFCRGYFPPRGGNHHHRHHQRSSHREREISINIFTSTISSPNPRLSLVSNSCLKVRDWC